MPSIRGVVKDRQIILRVRVGPPGEPEVPSNAYDGLLDTGATISGISARLIDDLNLEPNGSWINLEGVTGAEPTPLYTVNLALGVALPMDENASGNPAFFKGDASFEVAALKVDPEKLGCDVILGMDFLQDIHVSICRGGFFLSI